MTKNQSISLCTNSSFFDFSDVFNSSVAIVNTYLYTSVYNPKYFNDFMLALGLNATNATDMETFETLMYATSSGVDVEMDNLLEKVY